MNKSYILGKLPLCLALFNIGSIFLECCKIEDLPVVRNAHIADNRSDFVHGTAVAYKCDRGFTEGSGSNLAICLQQDNRTLQWTPPTLTCVLERCGDPPDLFHAEKGYVEGETAPYAVGSKAIYNCLSGYYRHEGTDTAHCILDTDGKVKWTKPTLDCKAEHCGDPGQVKNAERIGHLFTHPNSVSYTCNRGYRTEDKTILYCLPGGVWSDSPPVCEIVYCPVPEDPANGIARAQDITYLSVVVYSCDGGHRLLGERERHCTSNGTWSGSQPICEEVQCKPITSVPGGIIVHGVNSKRPGELMIMKCIKSDIRTTLKCGENGEWNQPPLVCEVPTTSTTTTTTRPITRPTSSDHPPTQGGIKCDDPGHINHGYVVLNQHDASFPTHANITFQCDSGYQLKGEATLRCLPSGEWEPSRLPACDKEVPMSLVIGLTLGALFLAILAFVVLGIFHKKRKRKRKAEAAIGLKRKANCIDARDIEETHCLEKDKKSIPVTSL